MDFMKYATISYAECNCYQFAKLVIEQEFGGTLPDLAVPETRAERIELLRRHEERAHWREVAEGIDGDVVIMGPVRGAERHIGVFYAEGREPYAIPGVLHCTASRNAHWTALDDLCLEGLGNYSIWRRKEARHFTGGKAS